MINILQTFEKSVKDNIELTFNLKKRLTFKKFEQVLWIVIVLSFVLFMFLYYYRPEGLDDAWITYRYSRNIATGKGFVYNPGEHVLGSSTPFYTMILALCGWIGLDIPLSSTFLSFGVVCITTLTMFWWLRKNYSLLAAIFGIAVLFLTDTNYIYSSTDGMETAVYIFFIFGSFYLWNINKYIFAFLFAGLAMLTRLDGSIVLMVLTGAYIIKYRKIPWKSLILPIIINASWFIFAYFYSGSFLPNSFIAKQYHTDHSLFSNWMILAILFIPFPVLTLAVPGLGVIFGQKKFILIMVLSWFIFYVLAYSFSELENYTWYSAPLLPAISIFAAVGSESLKKGIRVLIKRQRFSSRILLVLIIFCVLFEFYQLIVLSPYDPSASYSPCGLEKARYDGAHYVAKIVPKDKTILSGGIGMVGWFTDNYILDVAGLVSPQILAPHPAPWFTNSFISIVEHYKPDYFFDANYAGLEWPKILTDNYHQVATFSHRCSDFTDFVLWEKNKS